MPASATNRACVTVVASLALFSAILLSGCAMPIASGYHIQKESLTVRFIPLTPPHLAIRAQYRLQNVGTAPLNFVEVALPSEKSFGRGNFRANAADRRIAPEHEHDAADQTAPAGAAPSESLWRIPLPRSLRQKQKIDITLEYDLAAEPATDPRIFVGANAFYLNDSGWFPRFQEPQALFAEDLVRPNPTDLTVIVPAGFRATASGEAHGAKTQHGETEYLFRIRSSDFDPYVLAGQYYEQRVSTSNGAVVTWTFTPMPVAQAQQTAAQIAVARKFYTHNFGPLPKSMNTIYDTQTPGVLAAENVNWESTRNPFLPGTVYAWGLYSAQSLSAGLNNRLAASIGPTELAYTWFSHIIVPSTAAWMLRDGLASYAANLLDKSNGSPTSRADAIHTALADYNSHRATAVETPIMSLAPTDPDHQLRLAAGKMNLFLFALEDKCGRQNLIHAIAHMVYALRGQQYGYGDFRAALEGECHQNLAGFFRTWLNQKGIPADFRARYDNPNGTK